jgi:hypothetical protein
MRPMPLSDGSSPGGLSRSAGHWSVIAWLVGALLVAVGATSLAIYAGAADIPHAQPVYWFLQTVRQRSIAERATDIPFRLILPSRNASRQAPPNTMRCAAAVISLLA